MALQYPAEALFKPRAFIYSSNPYALIAQSPTEEVRVMLLNSNTAASSNFSASFTLSASNAQFSVRQVGTPFITCGYAGDGTPTTAVQGTLSSQKLVSSAAAPARKAIVMYDANSNSDHQFAGFGYSNARVVHQLPSWLGSMHGFYAAADAASSFEIARAQRSAAGVCQLGVGITDAMDPSLALQVRGGNARVEGSLEVTGDVRWPGLSNLNLVSLDPQTHRIGSNVMPAGVAYLDPATNLIPPALLPSSNAFQFLRAAKNVGIGTRRPLQRMHIEGTAYVSECVGAGNTSPAARLHAIEASAVAPTCILEALAGGDALVATVGAAPALTVVGSHPAVGICTSSCANSNALEVHGNTTLYGQLWASNIVMSNLDVLSASSGAPVLATETVTLADSTRQDVVHCYLPLVVDQRVSTQEIVAAGGASNVHFRNCGVVVDGAALFAQQPLVVSDRSVKTRVEPLSGGVERLLRVRGYTYDVGGVRQAGVMAHEVLAALPEAVAEQGGVKAVSYTALVPLLIEAVRDLAQQIRELRAAGPG